MPTREKNRLAELEQQDAALSRNEESIIVVRQSLFFKCRFIYRPLQIVFGLFLLSFALLIFISLLLSNINKLINFVSFQQIFAQGNQTLPNPIDLLLQWTGKVRARSEARSAVHLEVILFSTIRSATSCCPDFWSTSFSPRSTVYNRSVFGTSGFE